jgi:TonB family protein
VLVLLELLHGSCAPDPATLVGRSDRGSQGRALALCARDPQCLGYLEMLKRHVFTVWKPARDIPEGKVRVAFQMVGTGEVEGIRIVKSTDPRLDESCLEAFRKANPFPPPPDAIAYMFGKDLTATFDVAERR